LILSLTAVFFFGLSANFIDLRHSHFPSKKMHLLSRKKIVFPAPKFPAHIEKKQTGLI